MPQAQGVTHEAVVSDCERLDPATAGLETGYHRLSRRVNKMKVSYKNDHSLIEAI